MLLNIIFIIFGLGLIILGSNCLIDGTSSAAKKIHLSDFATGMIMVGFTTSFPELILSATMASKGESLISLGNIFVSNVFNIFFILGLISLFSTIKLSKINISRDIPIMVGSVIVFLFFGLTNNELNRIESLCMLILFMISIYYLFTMDNDYHENSEYNLLNFTKFSLYITLIGFIILLLGCGIILFVLSYRTNLIETNKLLSAFVLGTTSSCLELITAITALIKGKTRIILGSIFGSNVFNILFILGISGIVSPLSFVGVTYFDAMVIMLSALIIWHISLTEEKELNYKSGILFIFIFLMSIITKYIKK